MPQIKDIKPHIPTIVADIKKINGMRKLYVWGSYAQHIEEPLYRVKDIDLIAKTKPNLGLMTSRSRVLFWLCIQSQVSLCTKQILQKKTFFFLRFKNQKL